MNVWRCCLLLALTASCSRFFPSPEQLVASWPDHPFVSSEWKDLPAGQRYVQVKSLLANSDQLLMGRFREHLLDLLGPPSAENGPLLSWIVLDNTSGCSAVDFNAVYFIEVELDAAGRSIHIGVRGD